MIPPNQPWTIDEALADQILPQRIDERLHLLRHLAMVNLIYALGDPRPMHRALFQDLTPPEHPEFAGHYRGSAYPALKNCFVSHAFNEKEGTPTLLSPDRVAVHMEAYGGLIAHALTVIRGPSSDAITLFAAAMIMLGKVHPFLDGNGHVQRLTFQILAERAGYALRGWQVHPRPYGEKMDRLKSSADVHALAGALSTYLS